MMADGGWRPIGRTETLTVSGKQQLRLQAAWVKLPMLLAALLIGYVNQELAEAAFKGAIAENAEYRRQQFIVAGLMPIDEAARKRRDLRRLRVAVWLPGNPPTMEIERHRNGQVTLMLTWKDKPAERHQIASSIWKELKSFDEGVFSPAEYDLERIGKRSKGLASCHGDTADFEASFGGKVQTAGATQCIPTLESFNQAKIAAIKVFTQAAIKTQNSCVFDVYRPEESLVRCFQ